MQRRSFIKNTLFTATGIFMLPSLSTAGYINKYSTEADLENFFITPPDAARPWVFWMWMNGNITKEGITLDLEAMKQMGIGGAINFNSAVGIPRGPIDYASEEWMDATAHAVREADRLGIELALHNAPGYSGCGGPWVTPEMSMQELVWTETLINSTGAVDLQLLRPYAKFNYYKDIYVIAYPSLPVEKALMKDKLVNVWQEGKLVDKNSITDGNPETMIRLVVNESMDNEANATAYDITNGVSGNTLHNKINTNSTSIVLEFNESFEARAISIYRKPEVPKDLFDGPRDHPPIFRLESSDDNIQYRYIGDIRSPELRAMDTPSSLTFKAVKAKYFKLTVTSSTWLCEVDLHQAPRLGGWPGKTSHTHGDFTGNTPGITAELCIAADKLLDISNKMTKDGLLQWDAPAGNWTILRMGHTSTGEECAAHPDAGAGLEIDKFRKEALQFHFDHFLDPFIDRVKPLIGKSFKGITVDSWEAGKQNWTVDFPAAFEKKNKYTIISWMPAMTGRIVGSIADTERFLWDTRKVQADLLAENFYGHYQTLCHQRGLEFYAEPYGDGNFDSLQVGQHLDITMSEFWTRYIYGSDNYSKQAVSAAHAYGKKVVAAESFTSMPATAKWMDYPYSLKAEGDYFYTLGVNRLVFHTFVHQPYTTGFPGMTMGPFGMHIDRNNTWTGQAYGWIRHIQRSQYLLQQGLVIADICYFKGDNPGSGVPDIYEFLPQGYAGDVIAAQALHSRLSIKNGEIVLPDGMHYKVCIMAPLQNILLSSLIRLKELVKDGMTLLVNNKPSKVYGLSNTDAEIQTEANDLYGNLDGKIITEYRYGKGKIIWGQSLQQVFEEASIQPDFICSAENQDAAIHYMHKQERELEFYFISNQHRRHEKIVCSFRTSGKQPEIWNSENGEIREAVLFTIVDGRTVVPIELEPAGSLFIVFRKAITGNGFTLVLKNNKKICSVQPYAAAKVNLYADTQNDFSVALWAKPDTFAHPGKSMLFHPPQGEVIYGKGHAAFGLAAGRNGIRIYENLNGRAREVLACNQSIEGWTHLAVVYNNGKPSVYINARLAAKNEGSGNVIHPGMGTEASLHQFASYFEGNHTPPQLFKEILTEQQIYQLFAEGLPQPLLPEGIWLSKEKNQLKVLVWQNGKYTLQSEKQTVEIGNIVACSARELNGEWKVSFPPGHGAASEIKLPSLISLHKHHDFNVKHFSGTAIYFKTIVIAKSDLQSDKKLFLHLGRVEVIAEVSINGKKLDILWKEPFLVDITNSVREGNNPLEISITNLWPNRLIGDEYLPEENEYLPSNNIKKLPDWYTQNIPKPGQRITFSAWKTYQKTDPLFESGLLGPVQLLVTIEKKLSI